MNKEDFCKAIVALRTANDKRYNIERYLESEGMVDNIMITLWDEVQDMYVNMLGEMDLMKISVISGFIYDEDYGRFTHAEEGLQMAMEKLYDFVYEGK